MIYTIRNDKTHIWHICKSTIPKQNDIEKVPLDNIKNNDTVNLGRTR